MKKPCIQPPSIGSMIVFLVCAGLPWSFAEQQWSLSVNSNNQLQLDFVPVTDTGQEMFIEESADLKSWTVAVWRPAESNSWQGGEDYSIAVDEADGSVQVLVDTTEKQKWFARIRGEIDPETDQVDSDFDGVPDWLEEFVATIPANRDTDGDGVSDRVELLSASDPGLDEWSEQQQKNASPATGLRVFTPILSEGRL